MRALFWLTLIGIIIYIGYMLVTATTICVTIGGQ